MKLSIALSSLLVLLPLLTEAASVPSSGSLSARQNRGNFFNRQRQRQGQNRGQQQNQNNNNNKGGAAAGGAAAGGAANGNNNNKGGAAAGGAAAGGAAAGGAAGGAAAGGAAAGGAAANNGTAAAGGAAANNNGATDDLQTSLCLDPKLVNVGSENDGQDVPTEGQVASATSVNNFINFCDGQTLTNGQQVEAGSCNGIPMGKIVPKAKMPSAKFVNPKNLDVIAPDTAFTIQMAINNLQTGNFVNAQANYFSAPADLNNQQILIGHSHVTVEEIGSLTNTKPLDPTVFAFFKGLNAAAVNGVLTADVTAGLPAGTYRMCSINSASNHQPALVAIAQHGSLDDCSYFVVSDQGVGTNLADVAAAAAKDGGAAAGGAAAGGAAAGGAAGGAAAGGAAGGAAAGGAANGNNNNGGAAAGGAAAGGAAAGGAANGNNNGKNNGGAAAGGAAAGGAAAGGAAGGAAAGGAANGNNNGKNNGGAAAGGAAAGGAAAGGKNNGGAAAGGAAAGGAAAGGKNNGAAAGGAAAGGAAANNGGPLKLNGANGGQVNIAKPGLVPPQTAAQTNGQNRGQQQQGQQRGQQQRGPFGGFGGRNGRGRFA